MPGFGVAAVVAVAASVAAPAATAALAGAGATGLGLWPDVSVCGAMFFSGMLIAAYLWM